MAEAPETTPPATPGTSTGEFSFLYDLTTAPCFRQSVLLALGGGAGLGALNLYRNRDVMRAAETMVKAGCGVAVLSWIACRKQFYDEREMTYGAMEQMRRKQAAVVMAKAKAMRESGAKEDE